MYNKAMLITVSLVAIVLLTGLMTYRFLRDTRASTAQGDQSSSMGTLPIVTATIGGQQFNLEVASTTAEQNQGLSGRDSLGEHNGMLFVFSMPSIRFFWMKDMDFPLDMIWIRGNKIIGFQQNVPTPSQLEVTSTLNLPVYISPGLVDRVIEINSGEAAKLGLKIGDTVQINLGSS